MLITTDQNDSKHLFILLTDPFSNDDPEINEVLLVPLCSIRQNRFYDDTCTFSKQDRVHPFIKRDSYVDYRFARIEDADDLIRGVDNGTLKHQPSVDEGSVIRICDGLTESPHTPRKFVVFLERYEQASEN